MRKVLYILFIGMISCKSIQPIENYKINDNVLKDTVMFEKFDFELDRNDYKGYERASWEELPGIGGYFKLQNGAFFYPHNGKKEIYYNVIPPEPAFYNQWYCYYQSGNLKCKGKFVGLKPYEKIGIWRYYDETGKLIKEVNEDVKFKFWTLDKILEMLHNEGLINLHTGANRTPDKFSVYFIEEEKKLVFEIFHKEIDFKSESYWECVFDCNTGKYSKKEYRRYKYGIQMLEKPILKGSKEYEELQEKKKKQPYRTHNGRTYTEEEWKSFEEQEYQKYVANKNKKGFWDSLFGG